MKLPNLRKIFSSDFSEDQKALMDQLGVLFNGALEPLYNILNNKLTFRDNFSSTISEFTVAVDSNGTPRQATTFKLANNQANVEGLFVINAVGANDSTKLPDGAVFVSWVHGAGTISVTKVMGLAPDVTYKIKVIALG